MSSGSLWTETFLDSKQFQGQCYDQVSTYLCLSLGTTKAAVFVYHCEKEALPVVLVLVWPASTSISISTSFTPHRALLP